MPSAVVNPFKPTAGMTPPALVGRENVIEDFSDGLDEGAGAPGRLMRITGPRGSGKTVLLTELGNLARKRDWMVIDIMGREPLCESIQERIVAAGSILQGVSLSAELPFVKGEIDLAKAEPGFRKTFEDTVHKLTSKGRGLLVTIDEVQDADYDEMRVVASNVQYMIRSQQNVAFVFAGLTTGVMDLLNGKVLTFLRRAMGEELGSIPQKEVAQSFAGIFGRTGMSIGVDELEKMAQATGGYAYLIQLVGYYVWRVANRHRADSLLVTGHDADAGIVEALHAFDEAVLDTSIAGLSKPAIDYLLAMAEDDGVSSTADIAQRMGKSASYAATYRRVLIERQVIEATAPGYVAFSIPFMRGYMLRNREVILSRYGVK